MLKHNDSGCKLIYKIRKCHFLAYPTACQFSPPLRSLCCNSTAGFCLGAFYPSSPARARGGHKKEQHEGCTSTFSMSGCLISHLKTPTERKLLLREKQGVQFSLVKSDGVKANRIRPRSGGMENWDRGVLPSC